MLYKDLVKEFTKNPRDLHTVPMGSRQPVWFHVFVKNNSLYVEPAHEHTPSSKVKQRRLNEAECDRMLKIYHRRKNGERISTEATFSTYSQVYWYGIFAEMEL